MELSWLKSVKTKVGINTILLFSVLAAVSGYFLSEYREDLYLISRMEKNMTQYNKALARAQRALGESDEVIEAVQLKANDPQAFTQLAAYDARFRKNLIDLDMFLQAIYLGSGSEEFQKYKEGLVYRRWAQSGYLDRHIIPALPESFPVSREIFNQLNTEYLNTTETFFYLYKRYYREQLAGAEVQASAIADQLEEVYLQIERQNDRLQSHLLKLQEEIGLYNSVLLQKLHAEEEALFRLAVIVIPACLIVTLLFSHRFLDHSLIKPIDELKKGMSQINAGEYEARVDVDRQDELGGLAQCFNQMMDRLADIKSQHEDLDNEVRQRENVQQRLEKKSRELEKQKSLLESIVNGINEGVMLCDKEGEFQMVNPHAKILVGRGGVKGGSSVWSEAYGIYDKDKERRLEEDEIPLAKALKGQTVEEQIIYIKNENLPEGRYLSVNAIPIRDPSEEITGAVAVFRDSTERIKQDQNVREINRELRQSERATLNMLKDLQQINEDLKSAQGQLIQSEKLASIGQLAAGIAHEINNPVGFISNNVQVLEKYVKSYQDLILRFNELKEDAKNNGQKISSSRIKELEELEEKMNIRFIDQDVNKLISESRRGIDRIQKIISDLRTFSRKEEDAVQVISLNEVIDEVLTVVKNELKYKAKVIKELSGQCLVKGSAQRLGQVLINIFVNAAQAIEEQGTITVKTYEKNEEAVVRISDTGCGIPEENLSKVFDPFFTTKPVGTGTGLGLSIAYDIVKAQGGHIDVESEKRKGTTFTIIFPLEKEQEES